MKPTYPFFYIFAYVDYAENITPSSTIVIYIGILYFFLFFLKKKST